eukprot:CAMPEP_0115558448 /NCGR_PEP_ID=MMETSP0271-20121206/99438_1 /TAXON_ID=71861 /ORGANISM="Scrippsiella trochoidea, Strain CCMP3099" /LENGTH=1230 /DNA_ID=CAMNT_0002992453 /DNA_START=20 /DNA_END=3709 /DNA_ORIENTATION=-
MMPDDSMGIAELPRSPSMRGRAAVAPGTDATPQKIGPVKAFQHRRGRADFALELDKPKKQEETPVAALATVPAADAALHRDAGCGRGRSEEGEPTSSQLGAAETVAQVSKKRNRKTCPPKHRLAGKTPRGLAGRVAELVCARTTDTATELPGAALAECILQVTGPPNVTRAAARARHLLNWLRIHAKHGSARVCGRVVSPSDVKESRHLVPQAYQTPAPEVQEAHIEKNAADSSTRSSIRDTSLFAVIADAPIMQKESKDVEPRVESQGHRENLECRDSSRCLGDLSDEDSDAGKNFSDLSDEEDVDSEDGNEQRGQDDFVDWEEQLPDDGYPGDWSGAPKLGSPTFNEFAADVMRKAGVACILPPAQLDKLAGCPPLQPHQEAAIFLLHPRSPVSRLLVDHPTGSGKTREMIQVLDNFFYDKRPKVPVFPKEPVCRNFYAELLRWPSKYRDYFCCLRPHSAARTARIKDWRARRNQLWDISNLGDKELRAICKEMRDVLEMKGCFYMGRMRRFWKDDFENRFPNEPLPAAPLRALRYTSAGGRHTAIREEDGLPASALFKIGFSKDDPNVYSNKIVLMDEVHNLVRAQTLFGEQLLHLRQLLSTAKGAVLAGFTGTPILSEPQEGRQLLDIIKGAGAPLGDAGFVSSFPMRPRSLFPRSFPQGIPDSVLTPELRRQFVKKVNLVGESLRSYDKKRAAGLPPRRLQRYCNLSVHFGSMHDGKHGSKTRVLDDWEACAPKLHAIAQDVAAESSKAVVLVARNSGMDALITHLRRLAASGDGKPAFGVATMDELAAFNSSANLRGELYRVLVADSTQCGEGVSFFTVRRMLLADVPASPSALVQAVGRSIRMYGHYGLPDEEWTVTTTLYVAALPRWMRSPLGAWAYRAQRHHQDPQVAQSKARRLLRKLIKVGIPTLEVLKARLCSHLEQNPNPEQVPHAMQSSQAGDDQNTHAQLVDARIELPLTQTLDSPSSASGELTPSVGLNSDASLLPLSSGSFDSMATSQKDVKTGEGDATPLQDLANGAPVKQLKAEEVERFLESIGLWDEAKQVAASRQNLVNKAREGGSSGGHAAEARKAWLVNASDVPQLSACMNFSARSADEEAIKALVVASRALVPALQELRSEAIDRNILESLMVGQADQLGEMEAQSEGDDTSFDFGVSGASSEGEDAGPPPLVLPPNWKTEKVRRGKVIVREFVDPSGNRYKTEAQARKAVDALRRKANIALRLRQ